MSRTRSLTYFGEFNSGFEGKKERTRNAPLLSLCLANAMKKEKVSPSGIVRRERFFDEVGEPGRREKKKKDTSLVLNSLFRNRIEQGRERQ